MTNLKYVVQTAIKTILTSACAKLMMPRCCYAFARLFCVFSPSDLTPINPKLHASELISERQQMMMSDRNGDEDRKTLTFKRHPPLL